MATDTARKWYALYTLSNHEKRVEEHRTRALSYRGLVVEEEQLIASLLKKLGG